MQRSPRTFLKASGIQHCVVFERVSEVICECWNVLFHLLCVSWLEVIGMEPASRSIAHCHVLEPMNQPATNSFGD